MKRLKQLKDALGKKGGEAINGIFTGSFIDKRL
jgi:hypothetical protein